MLVILKKNWIIRRIAIEWIRNGKFDQRDVSCIERRMDLHSLYELIVTQRNCE